MTGIEKIYWIIYLSLGCIVPIILIIVSYTQIISTIRQTKENLTQGWFQSFGNSRLHFWKEFLKPVSDWKGKCWQTTTIVAFDQDIELVFRLQLRFWWQIKWLDSVHTWNIGNIPFVKISPSSEKCAMGLW